MTELMTELIMNELIMSAQDPSASQNRPTDTLAGIKSIIKIIIHKFKIT
jgi:hypothetical protein